MNVRTTGAVLAVTLGVLLSGCSSPDTSQGSDDVASLVSVAPPKAAASSAAPVSEERPLIRTDTSSEEEDRLYDVWMTCLEQNGAGTGTKRKLAADAAATGAKPNTDPGLEARSKKAEKKCAGKEPEEVWERARRLDPAYADKLRDWVTCIRSHGIDAWESDGFLTFESLPPENQLKKVDQCQDKAFGKG
jgi:hypothetical protein